MTDKSLAKLIKSLRGDADTTHPVDDSDFGDANGLAVSFFVPESKRSINDTWVPRASGLYHSCIRQNVLCTLHKKKDYRSESLRDKITYGFGNAVHTWVQNEPDVLLGRRGLWKCLRCGHMSKFGKKPKRCKACGNTEDFLYSEIELVGDTLPLTGHPDMFVRRDGVLRLVEFKTISEAGFADLSFAPLVAHQWQVVAYLMLLEDAQRLRNIDLSVGYVIYFSKGTALKEFPVKAFAVKRSPDIVGFIQNKLDLYTAGVDGGPLPDVHQECENTNHNGWRAKRCPCLKECVIDAKE